MMFGLKDDLVNYSLVCFAIAPFESSFLILQEKKALKEEKLKQEEKYMWAWVDGKKEKVTLESLY